MTLLIVPLHDREEWAARCLDSLYKAGADFELAIVANGCDFDPTIYAKEADYFDAIPEPLGPTAARNIAWKYRRPGQDVMTIDSDIVFETRDWLKLLLDTLYSDNFGAVTPCIGNPGPPWFHGVEPNTGVKVVGNLPVGARLHKGETVDRLGYYRRYGFYGCEDLDYDARMHAAGYRLAYNSDVVVSHPGIPSDDRWKRQQLDKHLPLFKVWEKCYWDKRFLFKEAPEPEFIPENNPRWLEPGSEDPSKWGSHLRGLKWAVEHTEGPILELGAGFHSTPFLHSVCESGRLVITRETNKRWLALAKERMTAPKHWVVEEVPFGMEFAVVLNDGPGTDRVLYLEKLRDDTQVFVNHDTENAQESVYGWEPALSSFKHRFDYGDVPRTTLTSDHMELKGVLSAAGSASHHRR